MQDIYTSLDPTRLGFYKSILDEAGIACYIRNENIAQLVNVLAMPLQPTLCIVDDDRYEEALQLLRPHHFTPPSDAVDWSCPSCNESNPATFDLCWNCDSIRPDSPSPSA